MKLKLVTPTSLLCSLRCASESASILYRFEARDSLKAPKSPKQPLFFPAVEVPRTLASAQWAEEIGEFLRYALSRLYMVVSLCAFMLKVFKRVFRSDVNWFVLVLDIVFFVLESINWFLCLNVFNKSKFAN